MLQHFHKLRHLTEYPLKLRKPNGAPFKIRLLLLAIVLYSIVSAISFTVGTPNVVVNPVGVYADRRTAAKLYEQASEFITSASTLPLVENKTICSHFVTSTISMDATSLADLNESDIPSSPDTYRIHRKGTQCFSIGMVSAGSYGVSIVLDGDEVPPGPIMAADTMTGSQLSMLFNRYYTSQVQVLGIVPQPIAKYCGGTDLMTNSDKRLYTCEVSTGSVPTMGGGGGYKQSGNITHNSAAGESVMNQFVALVTKQGFVTDPGGSPNNVDNLNNADGQGPYFAYSGSLDYARSTHGCTARVGYYPNLNDGDMDYSLTCTADITSIPSGFTKTNANL